MAEESNGPNAYLVGGKITQVTEKPDELSGHGFMTTIEVAFPSPKEIKTYGFEGIAKAVTLEVWQDEEGNGPGELVLVAALELVTEEA